MSLGTLSYYHDFPSYQWTYGLSPRDWFAGIALQEMLATDTAFYHDSETIDYARSAEHCYKWADAMIEAATKIPATDADEGGKHE